jgi:Predicted membrane protein
MSVGDVFGIHAPFWEIVYRSAIVYGAIVVGMRLTGARQLGQMTPFDLVLIDRKSNAVQNAMVGSDVTVLGGLTAAAKQLLLNRAVAFATDRIPAFRKVLEGEPVVVLSNGKLIERHIAKAGLSDDMVLQSMREHGFDDPKEVRLAILEVDGTISIIPTGGGVVRTRHRVRAVRPGGN